MQHCEKMTQNFCKWKIMSLKLMSRVKNQLDIVEERISDQKLVWKKITQKPE